MISSSAFDTSFIISWTGALLSWYVSCQVANLFLRLLSLTYSTPGVNCYFTWLRYSYSNRKYQWFLNITIIPPRTFKNRWGGEHCDTQWFKTPLAFEISKFVWLHASIYDSADLGWGLKCPFLVSSQVMLRLLVDGKFYPFRLIILWELKFYILYLFKI